MTCKNIIKKVWGVFRDARRFWRVSSKWTRGRGASLETDVHPTALERPLARAGSDSTPEPGPICHRWAEVEAEEAGVHRSDSTSSSGQSEATEEFRARASTDSRLPPRPARLRHPPVARNPPPVRRMSVAMRGNNASTY
ncbi:uncharacterized protein LOC125228666 [Leguminivora glycinivorella]|uniref:uncharacterized protein LOC125228666 n=1 Tax=Leguminivora glycinivorella TaxID=1035111 RepID=UPI00200C5E51|nr:uncharacterized protein LOC125228666 [Leguminivora glycinivorella]